MWRRKPRAPRRACCAACLWLDAAPEAARGGPIAALEEGDIVVFDIDKRRLDVELDDATIQQRLASWSKPASRYNSGVFSKYAALVSSAAQGAVTSAP